MSRSAGAIVVALPAFTIALPPAPAGAEVRVEAQLSAQELPSRQAVELILSAVSSEGSAGTPDLSVLERDFQILDRRVERRASVTNGKRREEVRLRLVLLPRHVGDLEVPSVAFGKVRSQPLRLAVKGEDLGPYPDAPKVPSSPLLDLGQFEPRGSNTVDPFYPGYHGDWSATPWLNPAATPGGALDSSSIGPSDHTRSQVSIASTPANPTAEPTETSATLRNPWFWISLALAAVLAGVLGRRRGRSPSRSSDRAHEVPEPESAPPDPLETAVETVRTAYRRGDGSGARDALLDWGRLRWPQDPPGNLARLAKRCPPPLREHITELEKAFFSPDPIHWERDPVPDELLAQLPTRVNETAAP